MPQMSPMWWELLMIMFILLFIMTNSLIYWINYNKPASMSSYMEMSKDKWKW
nr:ATPase subunit 8 [Henestaris halophilus]